jgi:lipopolysaccharide/colanic/teichoic acid biosynthesis glycosyltransferase
MTKRILDVVAAACAMVLLGPLLAALALAIRISMGGPVLFRQVRIGLGGRTFRIAKFRTMSDARDSAGNLLTDKERLTALGAFIRRASLDELPQLWNVIIGDMSVVGPRPLLPQYLPRYSTFQRRRHEMRPGITGWVQVNGRNSLTWEQKFELDVWYVDHGGLCLDVKILWLTVLQVLRRDGISQTGHATMPEFMGSPTQSRRDG